MRNLVLLTALFIGGLRSTGMAQEIDILSGVRIPCRDGIRLNATVYKPHELPSPLPVLLFLTPYIADGNHKRASWFAQHGFVFVCVDSRGRGSSEGVFDPFMQEARDGYDIVEWLAKQPY